ncbi:MAG: hypothetical protein P8N56_02850 [Schleiferiaceae bacterium]|nr:hypothetical protein [Schleiferiaceae bacterium]
MRNAFLFSIYLLPLALFGQETVHFSGQVIEEKSKEAVPWVIIVNARNETAFNSDENGVFDLYAETGDTLVFSKPGYAYRYAWAREENRVAIELLPQNYLLDEVPVTAYKLTSNLPKEVPLSSPNRPEGGEIRVPRGVKPTLANPLDLLYDQFGKRPRQLRELEAILESEAFRDKLSESNNRSALFELTGLTPSQVEEFLLFCHWNETAIYSPTDYELLRSLMRCFAQFQAIQEQELRETP